MTTLKKASALFLSFILSDHPHCLCCTFNRILYLDTNLDLHQFMAMDEKLRHFGDPIEQQSYPVSANSD